MRQRLGDALWGPETGRRLLFVHTALAVLIGLRVALSPFRQLAEVPPALYEPVPIAPWRDAMPGAAAITAVQLLGVVAAVAAALRWRTRLTYAAAWACLLLLAGLRGSRGKVLHNDLLLLWVSAPFLLAPADVAWSDTEARRDHGWPVRTAMAIAAAVYFFAGYHKLRRSGLDWATGDNVRYVMLWGPTIGRARWDSMARWVGEQLWAARATGGFILFVELTFPVAVLWARTRWFYVAAAVSLHVATWLLLGLDYWTWAATVLLLFPDWEKLASARRWSPRRVPEASVA